MDRSVATWPKGIGLDVFETIDSTNEEARRRAAQGEVGPIWLVSRQQTAGRGRHGRGWASPPGNMAATHMFPFKGAPADAARLSFVAALAVADVLEALAPGVPVGLKWPNDALLGGKKVAGILLENLGPAADGDLLLVIGIGLNLLHHPPDEGANWPPTSLIAETGSTPDFDRTLVVLASQLAHWLDVHRDKGFSPIRAAWLARAIHRGDTVQVRLPSGERTGRFIDLDADGNLVLEAPGGRIRIAAGDVYFPGD